MTNCENPRCATWAGRYHIDGCEYATPGTFYIDYKFDLMNMRNKTEHIKEAFAEGVDSLIEANKYIRTCNAKNKELFPPAHWAEEMCTIHIDCGRRVGKTEYIKDHLSSTDHIVIVNSLQRAIDLKCELNSQFDNQFDNIYCVYEVLNNQLDGISFSTIWMDEIGFDKSLDIVRLYGKLVRPDREQTFIRFGR